MFKKFTLLLCFMACAVTAMSQVSAADSLQLDINRIVAPLDKSQVPTGMLEEYGLGLLPLDVFGGTLTDSTVADAKIWRGLYASLYTSRIYGTNPMSPLSTVNTTIKTEMAAAPAAIPVVMLDYSYARLRPDAVSAGLLRVQSGQLFDVAGRPASPYLQKVCFAAAPTKTWSKGQPSLLFKQSLYYSNRGKTISSIKVDFADGYGLRTATYNTAVTAAYGSSGKYRITIQVTYTDNTVVKSYANIEVSGVGVSTARFDASPDAYQPFSATSSHSGGDVYIGYSSQNTSGRIKKPLIVVEGYDVSAIAPNLQRNYEYADFIAAINVPTPLYDFNSQLDLAAYDIVFIDFRNGTDDIRRNAALVKDVISWVNQQKAAAGSSQQNVVLGLSMGGLVARYALADMTKQGVSTGTRLLLTHDSPHRGANIPIGVQYLITFLNNSQFLPQGQRITDIIPELVEAKAVSEAPATGQMLLLRSVLSGGTYNVVKNTFLDNEYRTMITFPSGGTQPTYKVYATSLGSQCGNAVLSAGTKLVDIKGRFRLSFIILRADYYLDLEAWALNNTNTFSTVSNIKFYTNKTALFIPIGRTLFSTTISINPIAGNISPWDVVPGGTQSTLSQAVGVPSQIPDQYFNLFWFLKGKLSTQINVAAGARYTFVPLVSALDVATIDNNSLAGKYIGGYTQYNSRASNFIAQEQFPRDNVTQFNEEHIAFTPRNSNWMFNEMQGIANTLNCTSECSIDVTGSVSGPDYFCSTGSYQVGGSIPAGATVTWSATPSGIVTLVPNGNSVTVTKVPSAYGQPITLSASLGNACGSNTIATRTVTVGPPSVYLGATLSSPSTGVLYGSYNELYNSYATLNLSSSAGYTSGTWTIEPGGYSGATIFPTNNGRSVSINFGSNPPLRSAVTLNVNVSHACGTGGGKFYFVYLGPQNFSVTPNPASGSVRIEMSDVMEDNRPHNMRKISKPIGFIQHVQVVDKMGNLIMDRKFPDMTKMTTLDVSSLRSDLYILRVFNGLRWSGKQILVQH